jgi:hypothetical protein
VTANQHTNHDSDDSHEGAARVPELKRADKPRLNYVIADHTDP